jgi:hypothetical protein
VIGLYERSVNNHLVPSFDGDRVAKDNLVMRNLLRFAIADDRHLPDNQHVHFVHGELCPDFLHNRNHRIEKRNAEDAHAVPEQPLIMSANIKDQEEADDEAYDYVESTEQIGY